MRGGALVGGWLQSRRSRRWTLWARARVREAILAALDGGWKGECTKMNKEEKMKDMRERDCLLPMKKTEKMEDMRER